MGSDNMDSKAQIANQYAEDSHLDRIRKKAKDAPFVPIGKVSFFYVC